MANLKKILHTFYYDLKRVTVTDKFGDEAIEPKYILKADIESFIKTFTETRDANAYEQSLKNYFHLYLAERPKDGDSDWEISDLEQGLLDQCIVQPPIILAKGYAEKDLFFAIITAQLPQFLVNSQSNEAFFSSHAVLDDSSGDLFIFSAPYNRSNNKVSEKRLENVIHKDDMWEEIRQMQTNETERMLCLTKLVDQFAVDFNDWLTSNQTRLVWNQDVTPSIFFSELWAAFIYLLVLPERTGAYVSVNNVLMINLGRLPHAILDYDFKGADEAFPSIQTMLIACCNHLKGSFVEQDGPASYNRDYILGNTVSLQEEDVAQEVAQEVAQNNDIIIKKQSCWANLFCCCFSKEKTGLEEPLVPVVQNTSIA